MFHKLLCNNTYTYGTDNDPAKAIHELEIQKNAGIFPKIFNHDFVDGGWIPVSAITSLSKFLGLKYKIVSFDDKIDDTLDFIIVHPLANNLLHMYKFTNYTKDLPNTIGKFTLDHACVSYSIHHVVVGTFCDGSPVIYDSNYTRLFAFDWLNIKSKKPLAPSYIQKNYKKKIDVEICYAVYVNTENISKYSKHENTCLKIPKMIINDELYTAFQNNKSINPFTKRKIKINGPKYKELEKLCTTAKLEKNSSKLINPVCGFFIADIGSIEKTDDELSIFTQMPSQFLYKPKTLLNVAKAVCKITPSSTDKFVLSCINKVNKKLEEGNDVYIVGHAYGGAVAIQIAKHFNSTTWRTKGKLYITTFGSIYINKNKFTNIDVVNYMYINDIALKCNKCDKDSNVKWLQNKQTDSEPHAFFGNNYYTDMILTIFKTKSVHINSP